MKKSERTRTEILDHAWDLIAREGASLSMDTIAKSFGITRQLLYVHFKSRGGLLMAMVRHADTRFGIWDAFETAMATADPAARLDAVLDAWLDFVPRIHPVASDLIRLRPGDPDAAHAWDDRMSDLLGFYRRLTRQLADDNRLDPHLGETQAADIIWTLSSVSHWSLLVAERGWDQAAAAAFIKRTVRQAILA